MCPLPHTAHYRSDVNAATLTTKEASILKSIRTIHRLPSHQAAHPTPALLPPQDGPWSRPQQNPPYQHPQLPSKRLSLILSPLIHQIHAPSTHSTRTHTHSHTCMCGQMGLTSPRLCYHLVANERLHTETNQRVTRHATSAHSVLRILPPFFDTPNL